MTDQRHVAVYGAFTSLKALYEPDTSREVLVQMVYHHRDALMAVQRAGVRLADV